MEVGRREREVERERGEELEIETGRNRDREIEKQRERQGDRETQRSRIGPQRRKLCSVSQFGFFSNTQNSHQLKYSPLGTRS